MLTFTKKNKTRKTTTKEPGESQLKWQLTIVNVCV